MKITTSELDSLDSILRRAEDDWSAYYQSGYGPKDFPTQQEWRQHVRTASMATLKPAIRGHLKTGQRSWVRTRIFIARRRGLGKGFSEGRGYISG